MFKLMIVGLAVFSILFLTGYTFFLSSPEYLDYYSYFSIFLLVSISLLYIHYCIKFKTQIKERIEQNKKDIKLLKESEIKDHILKKLEDNKMSITEINEVISILKIGKLGRSKLENYILKEYQLKLIKYYNSLQKIKG